MKDDVSDYKAAIMWFDKCAKLEDAFASPLCSSERDELMKIVRMTKERLEQLAEDNPDVYDNMDLLYEIDEKLL